MEDISPSVVYCAPIYNGQIVKDLSSGMMHLDSLLNWRDNLSTQFIDWGKTFLSETKVLPISEKENKKL